MHTRTKPATARGLAGATLASLCLLACSEDAGPATATTGPGAFDGGAAPTTSGQVPSVTGGQDTTATTTTGGMAAASGGATAGATTATGGATGDATGAAGDASGGTGGATGDATAGAGEAMPACDVAEVLKAKCQNCHNDPLVGGAPMPLVTMADFQGMGPTTTDKDILTLVGERIHDPMRPMPPAGDLTPDELAAIDGWLAAGAPPAESSDCGGGAIDGGDGPSNVVWPPPDAEECYTITSHGGSPDQPQMVRGGTETHPQVIWDAPWGNESVQAVGFRNITDNAKILHHWILYANDGPGAFLTGWAPGTPDTELPEDVGMYLPTGPNSLRLDMHYYNKAPGAGDEPDQSGVEICVAKVNKRPNTATVFMDFSNILGLRLPPQQATDIVDYCQVDGSQPIKTLSVSPHAHELATNMKLEVRRADGTIEVWHDEGFDFEDQQVYDLQGKVLNPGDVVKTTCSYNNTTNQTVTFGEDTGNEMCFNFVTYYPMGGMSCNLASDFLNSW